jgi:hypothetical protein
VEIFVRRCGTKAAIRHITHKLKYVPFYNAQLFEITGTAKGVFTYSQSSCHIAKVVLTIRHDSRQIPLAARHHHTFPHRGFLHWRFAYAGPGVRRVTVMGPPSANLHKSGSGGISRRRRRDVPGRKIKRPLRRPLSCRWERTERALSLLATATLSSCRPSWSSSRSQLRFAS